MKNYGFCFIRGEVEVVNPKTGLVGLHRPPIITVCIGISDVPNYFVRGVSICSNKDNVNKSTGKEIALKRARDQEAHLKHMVRVNEQFTMTLGRPWEGIQFYNPGEVTDFGCIVKNPHITQIVCENKIKHVPLTKSLCVHEKNKSVFFSEQELKMLSGMENKQKE